MRVCRALTDDAEAIAANNVAMAQETENKVLGPSIVDTGVRAVLADSDKGFYLVAEEHDHIVGQLLVTFEWSDWRNAWFWWIQSVYVVPPARRQGVYSALHDHVCSLAQEQGDVCGIRLYVDADNDAGHRTYESLGMKKTRYHMYELMLVGSDVAPGN